MNKFLKSFFKRKKLNKMVDNTSNESGNVDKMIGKLIFDRYKLLERLGSGSFGSIYKAEYQNKFFAIKLEDKERGQNLLENEAYIMSYLRGPGIPMVKSFGCSSKHNILVMELMGKSLEDIFESFVVKKMSIRCVCNIGYQMIEILEYIHDKHIIHRDIKPDNFVVGLGNLKKYIYLLDFGLSKKFRSSRTLKHYQLVKNKNLTGTARYASINALNGMTQSRRDDLEAVGYVLMYFLRGRLPWQGIPVKNKEDRYRKIMEKKIATSPEELCEGFPIEFSNYIDYTRKLEYEQDPNYNFLKGLFLNVLYRDHFRIDCFYDWDNETINYFRDFKNAENNNGSKADLSSMSNNQQFHMRDVNSYSSLEKKSSKLNNQSNTNMSLANYHGSKYNGAVNSITNYEGSAFHHRKNDPALSHPNEIEKVNTNVQAEVKNNAINTNQGNYYLNTQPQPPNNNNIEFQTKRSVPEQNGINNKENVDNNQIREERKMNPRTDKDNKCCIIF